VLFRCISPTYAGGLINIVLRHTEPQLSINVDIVVPGEEVDGRPLRLRQTHHLRKTRPDTAIEVRYSLGSNDRDIP